MSPRRYGAAEIVTGMAGLEKSTSTWIDGSVDGGLWQITYDEALLWITNSFTFL